MPIAECPECHFRGPHIARLFSANLTCANCHVIFGDPDLLVRRAQSFDAWTSLVNELNRIIDAPDRRRAMRTEYRRRTRSRTRSRR